MPQMISNFDMHDPYARWAGYLPQPVRAPVAEAPAPQSMKLEIPDAALAAFAAQIATAVRTEVAAAVAASRPAPVAAAQPAARVPPKPTAQPAPKRHWNALGSLRG